MKVLHLDASPRADRSRSRQVALSFLDRLSGHAEITSWSLWNMELPSLGGGMIEARYDLIRGREVPSALEQEWSVIREFCADFLRFDLYAISTPMWNFSIPYKLKQFIDVVTQPGLTFTNDAAGNVVGLAAGRSAVLFAASAMPFGKDEQLDPLEFQISYLETWLKFIGVGDIHHLRISPTFGQPEDVDRETGEAIAGAGALASRWGAT